MNILLSTSKTLKSSFVGFNEFLHSGNGPTLFSAFLYFDCCFAIWVLNGAMAPFITEQFKLSPASTGFMISVPIFAGALMRFPLGILAQYIGRKNAAIIEMSLIMIACFYGCYFLQSYRDLLIMGVLLGIAGASFGVALSLGSGWFPKQYKGLAMGITGAGNGGTVIAALLGPPLATMYGWHAVYGFAGLFMIIPLFTMIGLAKEPPDRTQQTIKEHLSCLREKDGWVFNLLYVITFGGFIGLANFLPTFFYDQFSVTKIQAGQLTVLATFIGSFVRIIGGYLADRFGGIITLKIIFTLIVVLLFSMMIFESSLVLSTIFFILCFAILGIGNGALFQLVPLRWPLNTAIAGSMIGEIGALGGAIIPNLMGQSKEFTGSFTWGFFAFAILALLALIVLRRVQNNWAQVWVDAKGKALSKPVELVCK